MLHPASPHWLPPSNCTFFLEFSHREERCEEAKKTSFAKVAEGICQNGCNHATWQTVSRETQNNPVERRARPRAKRQTILRIQSRSFTRTWQYLCDRQPGNIQNRFSTMAVTQAAARVLCFLIQSKLSCSLSQHFSASCFTVQFSPKWLAVCLANCLEDIV